MKPSFQRSLNKVAFLGMRDPHPKLWQSVSIPAGEHGAETVTPPQGGRVRSKGWYLLNQLSASPAHAPKLTLTLSTSHLVDSFLRCLLQAEDT